MNIAGGIMDALYGIMNVLFNEVFAPILTDILSVFGEAIIAYLAAQYSYLCYLLLVGLCSILDGLEAMVNVFAGTEKVLVEGKPMTLMEMFFQLDGVSQAFLLVSLVAVCFCIIFTIISTARSMSSMTMEDKNPISQVLKNALKAAVSFLTVPFFCVFLLQITTALTIQINTAVMNQTGVTGQPTTGTYVFLISSLRAGRKTPNSIKGFMSRLADQESNYLEPDIEDDLRMEYLSGKKDYKNLTHSGMDFSPAKFDYLMGFISVIFMIFMFIGLIIQFVRRLLELLLLYLVSPFFVAAIPADEGAMFRRWRDMFIAKFLSSFGVVFSFKIFLLLLPLIFSSKLDLGSSAVQQKLTFTDAFDTVYEGDSDAAKAVKDTLKKSGLAGLENRSMIDNAMYSLGVDYESVSREESVIDSLLKLLFMMGGVLAIYKSQSMVLEVLNPQAANDSKEAVMLALAMTAKAGKAGGQLALGAATGGAGTAAMAGVKGAAAAGKAGMAAGKAGMAAGKAGMSAGQAGASAGKAGASAGKAGGFAGKAGSSGGQSGGSSWKSARPSGGGDSSGRSARSLGSRPGGGDSAWKSARPSGGSSGGAAGRPGGYAGTARASTGGSPGAGRSPGAGGSSWKSAAPQGGSSGSSAKSALRSVSDKAKDSALDAAGNAADRVTEGTEE